MSVILGAYFKTDLHQHVTTFYICLPRGDILIFQWEYIYFRTLSIMRLTTSKIITIVIGCIVAGCIGAFAPQCISPKFEEGIRIISASVEQEEMAMIGYEK